jgi:hypothetical protein
MRSDWKGDISPLQNTLKQCLKKKNVIFFDFLRFFLPKICPSTIVCIEGLETKTVLP